jgi:hypothetical protein
MRYTPRRQASCAFLLLFMTAGGAAYADDRKNQDDAGWFDVTAIFTNATEDDYELTQVSVTGCPVKDLPTTIKVPGKVRPAAKTIVTQPFQVQYCGLNQNKFLDVTIKWHYRMSWGILTMEEQYWTYSFRGSQGALKGKFIYDPDPNSKPLVGSLLNRNGTMLLDSVDCGKGDKPGLCRTYDGTYMKNSADLTVNVTWAAQATAPIAGYANGARRNK